MSKNNLIKFLIIVVWVVAVLILEEPKEESSKTRSIEDTPNYQLIKLNY